MITMKNASLALDIKKGMTPILIVWLILVCVFGSLYGWLGFLLVVIISFFSFVLGHAVARFAIAMDADEDFR